MSQRDDQHLEEIIVTELVNEDKGNFSNFRNYNEELDMLEVGYSIQRLIKMIV